MVPLSTTIFNVVVDAVVCHWGSLGAISGSLKIGRGIHLWDHPRHSYLPSEGFSTATSLPHHHLESFPVPAEEAEGPGYHDISLKYLQALGPIQGFIRLVQVQEYHVKDLLPHGRNLLEQFYLEGGGPCTATCPEPMKGVVVGDEGSEVVIDNHGHCFPHQLPETYATVVSAPFWG